MTTFLGLHMGSDNAYSQYNDFGTTFLKGVKVMARVSFGTQTAWSDLSTPYFINSATKPWLNSDPSRIEILTIPLLPNSPDSGTTNNTLSAVAAGQADSYWQALGGYIHGTGNESRIYVRLGWELNGDWYNWGIGNGHNGNTAAQYVAAFQRAVTQIRIKAPNVKFEWNLSLTGRNISWSAAYPGNSYVDVISMDVYDSDNKGWPDILAGGGGTIPAGQGLTAFRAFCTANGKPEGYAEWSLDSSSTGKRDNPTFIGLMYAWFKAGNVLHHAYYNTSAWSGSAMVYGTGSGLIPRGAQLYQTLWSKGALVDTIAQASYTGSRSDAYATVSDGTNYYVMHP